MQHHEVYADTARGKLMARVIQRQDVLRCHHRLSAMVGVALLTLTMKYRSKTYQSGTDRRPINTARYRRTNTDRFDVPFVRRRAHGICREDEPSVDLRQFCER